MRPIGAAACVALAVATLGWAGFPLPAKVSGGQFEDEGQGVFP
jgi:hypothetical protein